MAMATARSMAVTNTTFVSNTLRISSYGGGAAGLGNGAGASFGGAGLGFGIDSSLSPAGGGGFAASVLNNVSFAMNTILASAGSSEGNTYGNGAGVQTTAKFSSSSIGGDAESGPSAAAGAGAGAGLLLNEGDMLLRNCSFESNKNLNLPPDKQQSQEQDVCAFGATARAIFGHLSPAICSTCGGQGTCI